MMTRKPRSWDIVASVGLSALIGSGCVDRLTGTDDDIADIADTGDTGDTGDTDTTGESESDTGEPYELSPEDLAEIDAVASELELIVAGTVAYFEQESVEEGIPVLHFCPHPGGQPVGGTSSITPELDINCNDGPEGKCIPTGPGGGGAGQYNVQFWTNNAVWQGVGWSREQDVPHEFHYLLIAYNDTEDWPGGGYGRCSITAIAMADFDDDGIFSTYSISGTVDEQGAVIEPMLVELPFE